ncbi:MAG: carbohydrate ABC transporter permease [Clostridiales bacterium]|jgi:putative aldouronate transport system permease protein|nr:carbohydrate ABC transporter permease [Clostridiales bacterium]
MKVKKLLPPRNDELNKRQTFYLSSFPARPAAWIVGDILVYTLLGFVFVVTFFPFWNIFVLSLNDANDTLRGGFLLWPRAFTIDSYTAVIKNPEIYSALRVTFLRTIVGVPLTLTVTTLLAYALSQRDLPGRKGIVFFFILTMYFSGGLIPSYMVIKSLNLIDTFWVFIFPALTNVYWMILVRTYMEGLPKELEESAKLDGANDILILFRIILPLCLPVLATITLFSAISHWNAWYDSYIYTYKPELKTLSAVLVKILNQYQTNDMLTSAQQMASEAKRLPVSGETIRMTVTIFATVPIIIVYPFLQRYLIKGIMVGAIKG